MAGTDPTNTAGVDSEQLRRLRQRTGESLQSCKRMLAAADGDAYLAAGYLRYSGCAVRTGDDQAWLNNRPARTPSSCAATMHGAALAR